MTPTDALVRAAARLEADARLGREPDPAAVLSGTAAIHEVMPPDARDAARRHVAAACFLRSWAVHLDPERSAALIERADAQDVMAVLALAGLPRLAA